MASLTIPSPNKTEFKTGKYYSLTKVNAATVSVAHKVAVSNMISSSLNLIKP